MKLKKVAALIPAHNEELVIAKTIEAVSKIIPAEDIYIVSDGSSDKTAKIAKRYTRHVLKLIKNRGKAQAMNEAIHHFKLIKKYQFIMPMDADSQIQTDFLKLILPIFAQDDKKKIVCIVGKVTGQINNSVTAYRLWEYEIAQTIHKSAQDKENAILVCPGCATVYRSEIFNRVKIPVGTMTEDMDLTFLIHRQNLGKILFHPQAEVVTQDPQTITDLLKQLDRWYTGFWQCLVKHDVPWRGQMLDLEVAMLALEGLFNGLLMILLILLAPIVISRNPTLFLIPIGIDFGLFMLPSALYVAYKHRTPKILKYLPIFYLLRFLISIIFLKSFIKIVLKLDLQMHWNKALRYRI